MSVIKNKFTKILWSMMPASFRYKLGSFFREEGYIPPGWVKFGDLRRTTPIGRSYGRERGKPIDRYYIDSFIASHENDIKGKVLEIGDNRYTKEFGKDKVDSSDILNVDKLDNPNTTIVADLTSAPHINSNTFDCIIITQTLQFLYEVREAVNTLHRILKPGGVVLASVPVISQNTDKDCGDYWCWNFTSLAVNKIFMESFPSENLEVNNYGNVLVAISFLHGLATKELSNEELNYHDDNYEFLVTVRAVKPFEEI